MRPTASWQRRFACAALACAVAGLTEISVSAAERARPRDAAPPSALPAGVSDLVAVETAFQSVVDSVAPSVVSLRGIRLASSRDGSVARSSADESGEHRVIVNGAATIVRSDGLILTNEHVVANCTELTARLADGSEYPATIVTADPRSDLALLRIDRTGLTPARIGDWSTVARGQWCVALGNPYGLAADGQASVAVGVISNLGRQLPGLGEDDDRFYYDMIQTTASIHPGHSGGPLFNIRGELIGIVTAMHTHAPGDDGVGFAIPMSYPRRRIIDRLISGRPIDYGYLGAVVRCLTSDEREQLGLPTRRGVAILRIEPNGPADRAGLEVGDVITGWERKSVTSPGQLAELVGQTEVGAGVRVQYQRDGQSAEVVVAVEAREAMRVGWMRGGNVVWRGMRVSDVGMPSRDVVGRPRGVVVVLVDRDSPADRAGIEPGQIIEQLNGRVLLDTGDFLLWSRALSGEAWLTVHGKGLRRIEDDGPQGSAVAHP